MACRHFPPNFYYDMEVSWPIGPACHRNAIHVLCKMQPSGQLLAWNARGVTLQDDVIKGKKKGARWNWLTASDLALRAFCLPAG